MKIANDKRRAAQIVQPKDLNLQMMFAECNHLYFNDELKEIPIELIEEHFRKLANPNTSAFAFIWILCFIIVGVASYTVFKPEKKSN